LAIVVVAVLAGAANFRQIGSHAADLPQPLLARLGARFHLVWRRWIAPSESALRRLIQRVDAAELDLLVGSWLAEWARRHTSGDLVIALDGKVLRGAWDTGGQVTLFSALIHQAQVTIAQIRIPDKTNEITQVGALLEGIDAPYALVTIDAAHTQVDTAELIKGGKGWDYLMTIKANQPGLQARAIELLAPHVTRRKPEHIEQERGHGRINRWSTWTIEVSASTQASTQTGIDFPHAVQLACLRRDVFDLTGQPLTKELALLITSADTARAAAAELSAHARGHWGIESGHWIRDTVWGEDRHQSVTGDGPQVMATFRNLATGLIRLAGHTKIKETTEAIARDRMRALPLIP
jgi:predicted transposase YbfD/YdcC